MRPAHLTYSNVMSTVGVFIALGGTSYAVARNSVGEKQLKANSVTSLKVKDGSIGSVDLSPDALLAGPRGPRGSGGPPGPLGPKGESGPAGPAGLADAWFKKGVQTKLPAGKNATVDVVALSAVPAGDWLLLLTGNTGYSGSITDVNCKILVNGQEIESQSVTIGASAGAAYQQPLAMSATTNRTAAFEAKASCSQSYDLTGDTPGVRANLAAVRLVAPTR